MKRLIARRINASLLLSCGGLIALQFEVAGNPAETAASAGQQGNAAAPQAATTARAQDPGVRAGGASAGGPIAGGLTPSESAYFAASAEEFAAEEATADGIGPRMNLDSCGGCHVQPALGGSSPAVNPQMAFATKNGGTDRAPSFITADGPIREARFVKNADGSPDGGVHALFTITNRLGAGGCSLSQPDYETQMANHNVIFRIPTPTFGEGLVEQIPDAAIVANRSSSATAKQARHPWTAKLSGCGADDHGADQQQRQRRDDRAVWVEGAEQVAADLLG
ncbi:MAG TPA: hypothetical protein VG222_18195 [Vicinamibacterales bacterium]|jgi:hypothetical protein|nr:hypothetical protein [Vicinamibacterales bacterium]